MIDKITDKHNSRILAAVFFNRNKRGLKLGQMAMDITHGINGIRGVGH